MQDLKSPVGVNLPLAARKRIDAVCVRFEAAWKSGPRPEMPAFLVGTASAERSELLSELLKLDLHYRRRAGETPAPEQYLSVFPGEEAVIQAGFQVTIAGPREETPHRVADTPGVSGQATVKTNELVVVPGYTLLGPLGKGGMGVVYKATQAGLNRIVALKMILDDHASDDARSRFRLEAESLAQIQHENIIRVFEINETQGRLYFSMEFIKDGSLNHYLDGKPLPPKRAAALVATLARAVHAAHQTGVIHRDLKPANILLAFDTSVPTAKQVAIPSAEPWWELSFSPKITDFGLAKRASDPSQTAVGTVCGTPSYMAPEQADGNPNIIGPTTDVYSLGAILYELLTGRPPFKAATTMDTVLQLLKETVKPPRRLNKAVPRELEAICLKCLEKNPARRYASAAELADDLQRYVEGKPTKARPLSWPQKTARVVVGHPLLSAGVIALLAMAGAVPFLANQMDPERPRNELKARLKAGLPYTLPLDQPKQWPLRQVLGDPAPLHYNKADGCLTVETHTTVLWELIDDPMCDNYIFSAEVRHDHAPTVFSLVGIYFGYHEELSALGRRQGSFYTLSFTETGRTAVDVKAGTATSHMLFQPRLFELKKTPDVATGNLASKTFTARRAINTPAPWRKLQLKVGPDGVDVAWEEPGLAPDRMPISAKDMEENHKAVRKHCSKDMLTIPVQYGPRGGLGLYIDGSKAAFREVSIKPLTGGS